MIDEETLWTYEAVKDGILLRGLVGSWKTPCDLVVWRGHGDNLIVYTSVAWSRSEINMQVSNQILPGFNHKGYKAAIWHDVLIFLFKGTKVKLTECVTGR